jgi:hypothetical protein
MLIGKPTPQGYACITGREDGRVWKEGDTYTCAHASGENPCQRVIHVPAGRKLEELADICFGCMKVICLKCAAKRECTPFLKAIEKAEERDYRIRQYGLVR